MDDSLLQAARVIRPFLAQLVGPGPAADLDRRIADLLEQARLGQDPSDELRAVLQSNRTTWKFTQKVIDDAPDFRPPDRQPHHLRLSRPSEPPGPVSRSLHRENTYVIEQQPAGGAGVPVHGVRNNDGDLPDDTRAGEGASGAGDAPPEPVLVSRTLRAEFPTRVRTGDPLVLFAFISEQPSTGASALMRPVAVGSEIMLTCSAAGFDLRSPMQVTVVVPASGDSDPAPFQLVPTDPGEQTITVRAFAGSSYLGALSIQVTVDSTGRTGQPSRHSAALSYRDWQRGEVSLEIEYDEDEKVYTYRWRDGTFVPDKSYRNEGHLLRTPAEVVDGLVQGLNNLARGKTGYSQAAASAWLKNQGIGLWQSFFPPTLQAQFRENWGTITRLSIISKNDMIPWELLYASDQEGELGYLTEHFAIARLPQGGIPPALSLASADFVRPPHDSPAAAAREVEAIADILGGHGVDVHAAITDLDSLRTRLQAGDFSLLHFASHNSFSRTPPFDKISLGPAAFDPSFLNEFAPRAAFRPSSPLVFINACGSDRQTPIYTRLGGWADAFLSAGAGAFIGSLWEVRDTSSLRFATAFYLALADDKTIGESIAAARHELRSCDPSDPTWLAYTMWGDPGAKVALGAQP